MMDLEKLYERWFADKYMNVPASTQKKIRKLSEKYILSEYCNMTIRNIGDAFAQQYLQELIEKQARQSERSAAIDMMRDLCGFAVRKGIITYNPFLELRLPARKTNRHHALSEEDIRYIMGLDPHVTENIFFQIKLLTGTRTAECLGLCWDHVDFTRRTIKICDQLQFINVEDGRRELSLSGHLKNFKPRTIRPPAITFDLLKIRRDDQRYGMKETVKSDNPSFIFTDADGNPISPRRISAAFRKCMPSARERGLRLHDLRITNATMEYRMTGDLENVRKNLGHTSADVTMRYYIDPDPKRDETVADALDEYFKEVDLWK